LYFGFDYGEKYIGVASGDSETGICSPLAVIRNHSGTPDWQVLDKHISTWQPVAVVVGLPVHMDGSAQALTAHANGFLKRLKKRYNLPAFGCDERMTTRMAASLVRDNRARSKRRTTSKADLDTIAAALILETWFRTSHEND